MAQVRSPPPTPLRHFTPPPTPPTPKGEKQDIGNPWALLINQTHPTHNRFNNQPRQQSQPRTQPQSQPSHQEQTQSRDQNRYQQSRRSPTPPRTPPTSHRTYAPPPRTNTPPPRTRTSPRNQPTTRTDIPLYESESQPRHRHRRRGNNPDRRDAQPRQNRENAYTQPSHNPDNNQNNNQQQQQNQGYDSDDDFPTPLSLAEAQAGSGQQKDNNRRDNNRRDNNQRDNKGNKNGHTPCPPPNRRRDFFNEDRYSNVDKHAIQTPEDLARAPMQKLVDHLSKSAKDDVSRVRAFYVWIGAQDLAKFDWNEPVPENSALYQMVLVHSGHGTLNDLLAKLCNQAKIPCQMVYGAVKPPSHKIWTTPVNGYQWCAVNVCGGWRIVDQDAGTGYVIRSNEAIGSAPDNYNTNSFNDNDGLYLKKEKDGSSTSRSEGGSKSRTPRPTPRSNSRMANTATPRANPKGHVQEWERRNDWYCFPDPEHFIYDHFAEDKDWQLLQRPVTAQEFKQMFTCDEDFFGASFYNTSEPRGVIRSKNGQANILFYTKPNNKHRLTYELTKIKGKRGKKGESEDFNNYVYIENVDDGKMIKVFLKQAGIYHLRVHAVDPHEKEYDPMFLIARYLIECDKPACWCEPYPKNPRGEFGPGYDMHIRGIEPVSHPEGTINAYLGIAIIKLRCKNQPFEFTHFLEAHEVKKTKLSALSRHYHAENGEVIFVAKVPKAGRYAFRIYCKEKDTDDPFFNVCTYLIQADIGCLDDCPFPPASNGQIGFVAKDPNMALHPITHEDPIVREIETGDLHMCFRTTCPMELNPLMDLQDKDYREDLSEYVWWCICEDKKVEVDLRFPRAGIYSLNLYARPLGPPRGGEDPKAAPYQCLYKYVLIVNQPHSLCFARPGKHVAWDPHYQITYPKDGYLLPKSQIHYEVKIPGACEVAVLNHVWATTPLHKRGSKSQNSSQASVRNDQGDDSYQQQSPQQYPSNRSTTTTGIGQVTRPTPGQRSNSQMSQPDNRPPPSAASSSHGGKDGDWWEGDVDSGPGGRNATLIAKFPNSESFTYLLEFQVLSTKEMAKIRKEQEDADKEAKARLKQMDRRRHSQQTEADYRDKERIALADKCNEENDCDMYRADFDHFYAQRDEVEQVKGDAVRARFEQSKKPLGKDEERKAANDSIKKLRMASTRGTKECLIRYANMRPKMIREQMHKATQERNRTCLQESIIAFEAHRLAEEKRDLTKAKTTLDCLIAQQMLRDAVADKDPDGIEDAIRYIRARNHYGFLQREVQEAERLRHQLCREHPQSTVMTLNRSTISEIRSYQNPPQLVKDVMRGSLLLLHEHEEYTSDWGNVQKMAATLGHEGMNARIMKLDAEDMDPQIIARSKQILGPIKLQEVQSVSAGATAFLVWAKGTNDAYDNIHKNNHAVMNADPASIQRQKEIFGKD